MSKLRPRLSMSILAIALMAMIGCSDSSTLTETAGDPGTVTETAPVETGPSDLLIAEETVEEPMVAETGGETPASEESTELAAVIPVEPTPTVPAEPEPAEPEEPVAPEPLSIGIVAPPLAIDQWVMGEPIDQIEAGRVYVVEFWATWCPPCRTSMPHLSDLQEQYGEDVQFVGVTREDVDTVQGFLEQEQSEGKTWNEVVTYRLATDAGGATSAAYMEAAGQGGIPTAFIVGHDGVVEWIGHPMSMEEALAKVVAGDWDRAAALAEFEQKQRLEELEGEIQVLARGGEWDQALTLLDEFEAEHGSPAGWLNLKVSVLQSSDRAEEALALYPELVEQGWDDVNIQYNVARSIVAGRVDGDPELALRAAERASELLDHQQPVLLSLVAGAYHMNGQLEEAIEWQKKAVELAAGNPTFAATLEEYEAESAGETPTENPDSETTDESTPEEGDSTAEESESAAEESESTPEESASADGESESTTEESDSAPEE